MTAIALPGGRLGGISRRELTLWSGAALIVASLHAAGGWYLGQQPAIVPSAPAAENAVMIDLPPMAVAPEAVPLQAADLVDSVASETPEEITEQIQPVEPEAAEPARETAQPAPEPVERVAESEPAQEVVPDLVEQPLPEVALAIPEPRPVVERPKPAAKPAETRKPVEKKPEPVKQAKAEKPQKVEKPEKKKAAANSAAAQKSAQNGATARKGAAENGGGAISPRQWNAQVVAHIRRYLRMPSSVRRGGVAYVRFAVNSGGTVISASLARSSGDPAVDEAAVAVVRRASPVPAPPPSIAGGAINLDIPIEMRRR